MGVLGGQQPPNTPISTPKSRQLPMNRFFGKILWLTDFLPIYFHPGMREHLGGDQMLLTLRKGGQGSFSS